MRRFCFLLALLLLEVVGGNPATGQEGPVVERLIRLEEGQKGLGQRIEGTNQRIDDLRADMNQRSEDLRTDMNQHFTDSPRGRQWRRLSIPCSDRCTVAMADAGEVKR